MPEGCELAWTLHQRLASPAVRELGLGEFALEVTTVDLTHSQGEELLEQLDAIVEGRSLATKEIREAEAKKKGPKK